MRYFFHIVGGSTVYSDELGRDLLSLESAQRHAKVLAQELQNDDELCGSTFVRVVDEFGRTVFEHPVSVQ
jgi:hypothetical protein